MTANRVVRFVFLLLAIAAMPACSLLDGTTRLKNPATVDHIDEKVGIVSESVISDRRMVIYKNDIVCPEAPPDTASNISASISAAVDASAGGASGTTGAAVKGQLASQLATAISYVTHPSQGALMMRYALASACIAYMNGAITGEQYGSIYTNTFNAAVQMTLFELDRNNGQIGKSTESVQTTAPALSGSTASITTAANVAQDATATATKGAGKGVSDAAGKQASDTVQKTADSSGNTDSLATTTGQATHDAVMAATSDPVKADQARQTAIVNVYKAVAAQVSANPKQHIARSAAPPTSLSEALQSVAVPFNELNKTFTKVNDPKTASEQEYAAFAAMLAKDLPKAIAALDKAYLAYPTFHNIDELRALLKSRSTELNTGSDASWHSLYLTIVTRYSWDAPKDLLLQMKNKAG